MPKKRKTSTRKAVSGGRQTEQVQWSAGSKCEIYNEFQKQWIEGEVVDVFNDEEGEWIKVKSARITVELSSDSENIRIPSDDHDDGSIEKKDEWDIGSKCQLYSQEAMKWVDGEIINIFSDEMGSEWMRVQCGQRIRDVLREEPLLRKPEDELTDDKSG